MATTVPLHLIPLLHPLPLLLPLLPLLLLPLLQLASSSGAHSPASGLGHPPESDFHARLLQQGPAAATGSRLVPKGPTAPAAAAAPGAACRDQPRCLAASEQSRCA